MKKTMRSAVLLLIAAVLGGGVAQVGVTMSEKYSADVHAAALANGPSCSGGECGCGGSCASMKGLPQAKGSAPSACAMGKEGKACTDCDKHQPCDKSGATKTTTAAADQCPAKAAGHECTDCTQHPNCPDAKSTKTAAKPASK